MLDTINQRHKLISYVNLYDQDNDPILDPCFDTHTMGFVCGHDKIMFKDSYTMQDQFCNACNALREVKQFTFSGVPFDLIDQRRQNFVRIDIYEWNCETKEGLYVVKSPRQLSGGLYIARLNYWAMPNYGQFSQEEIDAKKEKNMDMPTAAYKDKQAVTVFEVPESDLYDPNIVGLLKQYLELPDTRAVTMINKGRRGDGTFIFELGKPINGAVLEVPKPP